MVASRMTARWLVATLAVSGVAVFGCGGANGDGGAAESAGSLAGGGAGAPVGSPGAPGAGGAGELTGGGSGGGAPGSEKCGNGLDDNADGQIDEGCPCAIGDAEKCFLGDPAKAGQGACVWGTQSCENTGKSGEFQSTAWGLCVGSGKPSPEICDGKDNDCDGVVDGVGVCPPMPSCIPSVEICDGKDNNCNGFIDEGDVCKPCLGGSGSSQSPWQIHGGGGPFCFGQTFAQHGEVGEYANEAIPPGNDPGWSVASAADIGFNAPSTLCGTSCECLDGGDFTYFQTFFDIAPGYVVQSLVISVGWVDDGVQVTIFNATYPAGVVAPGAYAFLGGGSTADLGQYIAVGNNRIVMTHLDDCCSVRGLTGVSIQLNGAPAGNCM